MHQSQATRSKPYGGHVSLRFWPKELTAEPVSIPLPTESSFNDTLYSLPEKQDFHADDDRYELEFEPMGLCEIHNCEVYKVHLGRHGVVGYSDGIPLKF